MTFQQMQLGCLAHFSYLIADGGVAAVVDPQRDVDRYLAEAERLGVRIAYVIETHLHADFVSGHAELAERTGATIVLGRRATATFPFQPVKDGDTLRLGATTLRVLETPGHTPEGISIVVEAPGEPRRVLTGDTLFVGDVGRPDLVASAGHDAPTMAGLLWDSLQGKLLALPDDTIVFPAHGAGSACGRAIASGDSTTIGAERRGNPALAAGSRDAFVERVTRDLPRAPAYFAHDAEENRRGAPTLHVEEIPRLGAPEIARLLAGEALAVDARSPEVFAAGHVPGSINVTLDGAFASWAGTVLPPTAPLVVIAEDDARADEAIVRLARVGLDRIAGVLAGGLSAWRAAGQPVATIERVHPGELARRLADVQVVDVRRPDEHAGGHIPGATNVPLASLPDAPLRLDPARPTAVACASGTRSAIAAGLLERAGATHVLDLVGGHVAWAAAGFPLERAGFAAP